MKNVFVKIVEHQRDINIKIDEVSDLCKILTDSFALNISNSCDCTHLECLSLIVSEKIKNLNQSNEKLYDALIGFNYEYLKK